MIRKCRYRYLRQNLDHRELLTRLGQTAKENNGESLSCDVLEFEDAGLIMTPTSEIMKAALNLVLCGRRGAGNTSAAKAILGQTEFPSVSNSSGRGVWTQGFPGGAACFVWKTSGGSDGGIIQGVHAFILVLPVGPLTDEDKGELQTIQNTFSSRVNDFTLILFTVESDPTAPAVVNFLKENKDIQELCQSCGGRHVVLNMKDQQQIPELLNAVGETRVGGSRCFTKKMFTKAQMEKVVQQDNTNKINKTEQQDVKKKSEMGGVDESQTRECLRMALIGKTGNFIIPIFTRGDELGDHSFERYAEVCGGFVKKVLNDCGGRYQVLNNKMTQRTHKSESC
ncbi:hypothetical protein F7725_013324 [Dissostichus mawsoni]|uniref:AIG1-type G domain-containing protein n=1 Tax=Dissostichus mawsoni TaxID=36200 RepID=A0A7J5YPR3_DISMA|nr:hypothetical protein F7725_013324 [Dissostichus mawsoni]